jgi:hypothetical protein
MPKLPARRGGVPNLRADTHAVVTLNAVKY